MPYRKNKFWGQRLFFCLVISCLLMFANPFNAYADASINDKDDLAWQAVRNNYKLYIGGQKVDAVWGNFSAYDFFILKTAGVGMSGWMHNGDSFDSQILTLIDASIANEDAAGQSSAKRVAGEYLAAKSYAEDDRADNLLKILQNRQLENGDGSIDNDAFSDIPAFELIGRAGDLGNLDPPAAIEFILDQRDSVTGVWTSSWNDLMTTAQAVRVLHYLTPYGGEEQKGEVGKAIATGLKWLESRQQADGSFQDAGGWDDPVIDTAEVIYTLKLLEIDPDTWVSAEGNRAIDYMENTAMNVDGSFGISSNIAANTWALDAYLQMGAILGSDSLLDLAISPASLTIKEGQSGQFSALALDLEGAWKDVSQEAVWSISEHEWARIEKGRAEGLKIGKTSISATYESMSASAVLIIKDNSSGSEEPGSIANIRAYIAIVGNDGNLLLPPLRVNIDTENDFGSTVVGALDAAGVDWVYSAGLVTEIEGQKNQGLNGWMCKVNEVPLLISAFEFEIENNDKIIWWYSYDPYSKGPAWSELDEYTKARQDAIDYQTVVKAKQMIAAYELQLAQLKSGFLILNAENRMPKDEVKKLLGELEENKVNIKQDVSQDEVLIGDGQQEMLLLIPKNAVAGPGFISVEELESQDGFNRFAVNIISSVYELQTNGITFNEPITICLKTAIKQDFDPNRLVLARYDKEQKQWLPVPAILDLENGWLLFKIDHSASFSLVELPARSSFSDLDNNYAWAVDAVEIMAGQGIIYGTGNGFEPERWISRAEFVQLVVSAWNIPEYARCEIDFTDVSADDWYAETVNRAYGSRIISGYPGGIFLPNAPISRSEAVSVLLRLSDDHKQDFNTAARDYNYTDSNSIPDWARESIEYASHIGIIRGYDDGSIRSNSPINRAEAAVVIYQYLNYLA